MAGFNYKDELMAEVYRAERMHEAEVERLVRLDNARKAKRFDLLSVMRAKLGKQFVLLGERLQNKRITRYT